MATDVDTPTQTVDTTVHSTYPIHFHGRGGSLFGIQIVNLFLSLITLGIYSFWGRVKVRRYLASQTEFAGDRFAYHGTGQELMIGWAKAMVLFGIPLFVLAVLQVIVGMESDLFDVLQILIYIVVGIFIPVAMVNARRYRLSRLSWRGVRFSFRGGVRDFIAIYIKGWLLTVVSLGFYYPFWQNRRQTFMVGNSFFGNQKFAFDGRGSDLFLTFVLHMILTLPTFFLCWLWYWARVQRYYADHTSFQAARLRSTVTGGGVFGLWFGNAILFILTLGLGWSWITVRNMRYYAIHLTMVGTLDVAAVMQEVQTATATGEGLSGFLDLDFDLG
ncbi:MAG: YjgN family protein [Candidatus Binatia bacterium]